MDSFQMLTRNVQCVQALLLPLFDAHYLIAIPINSHEIGEVKVFKAMQHTVGTKTTNFYIATLERQAIRTIFF